MQINLGLDTIFKIIEEGEMYLFSVSLIMLQALFSTVTRSQPVVVWDQLLTHPNSMMPELLKRALQVTSIQIW